MRPHHAPNAPQTSRPTQSEHALLPGADVGNRLGGMLPRLLRAAGYSLAMGDGWDVAAGTVGPDGMPPVWGRW